MSDLKSKIRLQKLLAACGLGARRRCEEIIAAGRVAVNGKVVRQPGVTVLPATDEVRVDGEVLKQEQHIYFIVNKPVGHICTNSDERGRPRVVDLIRRCPQRVYTVGRLDQETEGLILVTNDGELANRIAHPRYEVSKIYLAILRGFLTDEALETARKGSHFAEGRFKPHGVHIRRRSKERTQVLVHLREGHNREVRRLFARVGHPVLTLRRERIGGLTLKNLKPGQVRQIPREEALLALREAPQRQQGTRTKDNKEIRLGKPGPHCHASEQRNRQHPSRGVRPGGGWRA